MLNLIAWSAHRCDTVTFSSQIIMNPALLGQDKSPSLWGIGTFIEANYTFLSVATFLHAQSIFNVCVLKVSCWLILWNFWPVFLEVNLRSIAPLTLRARADYFSKLTMASALVVMLDATWLKLDIQTKMFTNFKCLSFGSQMTYHGILHTIGSAKTSASFKIMTFFSILNISCSFGHFCVGGVCPNSNILLILCIITVGFQS